MENSTLNSKEPQQDNRKTGIFKVSNMFSTIYGETPGYKKAMQERARRQIALRVVESLKDGRQYSVNMERTVRYVPSMFGGEDDRIEIHRVTILLVHPGDCEPGEWCLAFEDGEGMIPFHSHYRPPTDTKGCLERVW